MGVATRKAVWKCINCLLLQSLFWRSFVNWAVCLIFHACSQNTVTGCASDVSEGGLWIRSYPWKTPEAVVKLSSNRTFIDRCWGVKGERVRAFTAHGDEFKVSKKGGKLGYRLGWAYFVIDRSLPHVCAVSQSFSVMSAWCFTTSLQATNGSTHPSIWMNVAVVAWHKVPRWGLWVSPC